MILGVGNVWFHDLGLESSFDPGHSPWIHESSLESIDLSWGQLECFMTWVLKIWVIKVGFRSRVMKVMVLFFGKAMFQESSHENQMLDQGWGWFQDLGLENQA